MSTNAGHKGFRVFLIALFLMVCSTNVFSKSTYLLPTDLFGVSDLGNEVWVCGANGTILHSANRSTWEIQKSGVDENLSSIHFVNAKRGFVVGYHGTVLKTTDGGATWTKVAVESAYYLTDVFFVNESRGFIVGEYGTVLSTSDGGSSWSPVKVSKEKLDVIFNDIDFAEGRFGWIVGEFGKVLKSTDAGKTWKSVDLGLGEYMLFAVHVIDKSRVVITGADGLVCRTEDGGRTWKKVDLGMKNQLFGVRFTTPQTGFVFGKNILFRTDDGGESFKRQDLGKELNYGWIYRMSGTIAVGNNGTFYRLDKNDWSAGRIAGQTQVFEGRK